MELFLGQINGFVAVVLFTSFVKIATVLSVLRYGIGLGGAGMGIVVLVLSLALSLIPAQSQLERIGGLEALLGGKSLRSSEVVATFSPSIRAKIDKDIYARLQRLSASGSAQATTSTQGESAEIKSSDLTAVEWASFLISEVSAAFAVGLLLLVPLIVIDLIVVNVLMAMGIVQIPALVISLPLKLLLFVSVGGWGLVVERILS